MSDEPKKQLVKKIQETLALVGTSQMSESAYDIGWMVRLRDARNPSRPRYPRLLERLLRIQHADGSWGSQIPFAHDRVISTLSVITGASSWPLSIKWEEKIQGGLRAIESFAPKLLDEPEATVAFELLFPKLLNEVKQKGYKVTIPSNVLSYYEKLQKEKLAKLPLEVAAKQPTTLLHALEALDDKTDIRPFAKFQSSNGSFGLSPAATAFMLLKGFGGNNALQYLTYLVSNNRVSPVFPIDIFERAWCLFPIYFFRLEEHFHSLLAPHLQYLEQAWADKGVGWSKDLPVPDLDDTAMTFYVLQKSGTKLDPKVFERFETPEGFVCYAGERSDSASHYIHLLLALSTCSQSDPVVKRMRKKAIEHLAHTQTANGFWEDKWHISPYYATSRVILVLAGDPKLRPMVNRAVRWIFQTQHANGLWGFNDGTVEETVYALMGLLHFNESVKVIPHDILARGTVALSQTRRGDIPFPAWITKVLYAPSSIISMSRNCLLLHES